VARAAAALADPEERETTLRHLEGCTPCRIAYGEYARLAEGVLARGTTPRAAAPRSASPLSYALAGTALVAAVVVLFVLTPARAGRPAKVVAEPTAYGLRLRILDEGDDALGGWEERTPTGTTLKSFGIVNLGLGSGDTDDVLVALVPSNGPGFRIAARDEAGREGWTFPDGPETQEAAEVARRGSLVAVLPHLSGSSSPEEILVVAAGEGEANLLALRPADGRVAAVGRLPGVVISQLREEGARVLGGAGEARLLLGARDAEAGRPAILRFRWPSLAPDGAILIPELGGVLPGGSPNAVDRILLRPAGILEVGTAEGIECRLALVGGRLSGVPALILADHALGLPDRSAPGRTLGERPDLVNPGARTTLLERLRGEVRER